MIRKIYSWIKNLIKKKYFFRFLLLSGFSVLFPFSISAYIGQGVIEKGFTYFLGAFFALCIWITGLFARICGALLDWVINPSFISYSYTNPQNNPIIQSGLSITQGLVNIALVVVLIYTAVSIALKLANETEAKKMLARLVIVALLVNFAPVICGLIVDASNITMNYFLKNLQGGVSGMLGQYWNSIKELATAFSKNDIPFWDNFFRIGAQGIIGIITMIMIGYAFLLFTAIFLLRYFAIWILVILSPLAFVAWIIPVTKKMFWDLWWKQFIQWSIIGIPMAFFLYLGLSIFGNLQTAFTAKIGAAAFDQGTVGLFDSTLPYLAVVIFLFLGLIFGLQTSAIGANSIIENGNKAGKWARSKGWQGAKYVGHKTRQRVVRMEPGKVPFTKRRLFNKEGKTLGEYGDKWRAKKGSWYHPLHWARRGAGHLISAGVEDSAKNKSKKTEEKYKEKSTAANLAALTNPLNPLETKIGVLNNLIKRGKADGALKALGKDDGEREKNMEKLMKKARTLGADGMLVKAFPHLNATPTSEDRSKGLNTPADVIRDRIAKMKPDDYKNISKEALNDINVQDAILATAMGSHISKLIEAHGQAAAAALEQNINIRANQTAQATGEPVTPEEYFEAINPSLHKYIISGAGRGLLNF